jgi:hypothetical protein
VPETTVNLDRRTMPWQQDIGSAWQFCCMEAKAKTQTMKGTLQTQLGLGIFSPDSRHHSRAGSFVDDVDHAIFSLRVSLVQSIMALPERLDAH